MNEKIDVSPNVLRCLEVLREAVKTLPEGDVKNQAEAALEYLESAARGEPQPNDGISCPVERMIIPTGG